VLPLPSGRDRPKTCFSQQVLIQPASVQLLKLPPPSSAPLVGGDNSCPKTFQKPPFLVQSDFLFPLPLSMGGIELRLSPSHSGEGDLDHIDLKSLLRHSSSLTHRGGDFLTLNGRMIVEKRRSPAERSFCFRFFVVLRSTNIAMDESELLDQKQLLRRAQQAFERTEGSQRDVARALGLNRSSVSRALRSTRPYRLGSCRCWRRRPCSGGLRTSVRRCVTSG